MKNRINLFFFVGFLLMLASCGTSKSMHHQPEVSNYNTAKPVVTKQSDNVFVSGKNSLLKNK